jgi:FrmR/RcnR family transcriptional regulator, repressor of frmRAB operon
MPYTIEAKKSATNRLSRIKGQTEALVRAVEAGTPCDAILQQLAALRGAVNGLMSEVLEGHLREIFLVRGDTVAQSPAAMTQSIDQTMSLIRTYLK